MPAISKILIYHFAYSRPIDLPISLFLIILYYFAYWNVFGLFVDYLNRKIVRKAKIGQIGQIVTMDFADAYRETVVIERSCKVSTHLLPCAKPFQPCCSVHTLQKQTPGSSTIQITSTHQSSARWRVKGVLSESWDEDPSLRSSQSMAETCRLSNLLSIGKFDAAGYCIIFEVGVAKFYDACNKLMLVGRGNNDMYLVDTLDTPTALSACSHEKPMAIDTWHRRFRHASIDAIRNMERKSLVDGLHIVDVPAPEGLCEDCIYGKHAA